MSTVRLPFFISLLLILSFFLSMAPSASAQHDCSLRGHLLDTSVTPRQPISDATITVLTTRDSSLISFSRSLASGSFRIGNLAPGSYRLLISHIEYHTLSRTITLSPLTRDLDLGDIPLTRASTLLTAATVSAEIPPVSIRHDTIEFNAGSFHTRPNAVVEDLLKKLPGVQVDKNGTIKANGEEVKKILVDGKEFFGNDPKIASKNLPADAVDKVQVFDKKSDQAQFTGFDDGNTQKTINLTVKKDKKNGVFGSATASAGADTRPGSLTPGDTRYDHKFNLNQFNANRQLSALGMTNNTNRQGFGFQDVLGFSGALPGSGVSTGNNNASPDPFSSGIPIQGLSGNNQAITTTIAGGINFNDTWSHHQDISGSYFYNHAGDQIDQRNTRRYLLPENGFTQDQHTSTDRNNENHRISLISDHPIDSFTSYKLSSSFIYQHSNSAASSIDTSYITATHQLLNDISSTASAAMNGYNWNNNLLVRHRFYKKGRTLSTSLSFGLKSNTGNGSLYSLNHYYNSGNNNRADTLDQVYRSTSDNHTYGATLTYTEPLSRKSLFSLTYNFYQDRGRANKKTYDAGNGHHYDLLNDSLSNAFDNIYTYHREGIQIKNQQKNVNITAGVNLQQALSHSVFGHLSADSLLRRSYLNLLPNALVQYEFNRYSNLRLFYTTYTNQPSSSQLQPVSDNSDPLNQKSGNPDLRQEYYHNLRLNYLAFDPFRHTSIFATLTYTGIHNRIVNDDNFDLSGVRHTRPVNLSGLYRTGANLSWDFPIRWIKSSLNLNSAANFDHTASLVNGARNTGNSWTVSQGAQLNFAYKEILDIAGGINAEYNDVHYSLQSGQNQSYWTGHYTLDLNAYLPGGFSIASDLDYIRRTGLPAGYTSNPLLWNAGLARSLFRNKKGEVRLQVFDLLRQNTGFSRNTNQNYIEDVSYRTLRQYWLLSFTYHLSRFAGKSIQVGRQTVPDIRIMK